MMSMPRVLLALTMCVAVLPAFARTLEVGEGHEFQQPSAAVAAAKDGDTIDIYPGQYFDCASIRQNNIIIEGKGSGVVIVLSLE